MSQIDKILSSEMLSEDVKQSITEAWNAKINEAREEITAELREEFASRYENDKAQIVEAMDAKLSDTITAELEEFAIDKKKLAEDRVAYRKSIKEHAKLLDKFIMETLQKEISELRSDRAAQKANFGKLEEFVMHQLQGELNEFHQDRRSLVEQKVKLVKEGKKAIAEAKATFVKNAAAKSEKIIAESIRGELGTLRKDIQTAKENDFGRKIFESFAAEFMTSTLSEGTEVSKLTQTIDTLKAQLDESKQAIATSKVQLKESSRKLAIQKDKYNRKEIMSELMSPLSADKREIMGALLESVKTDKLRGAYDKYLPNVLTEGTVKTQKTQLTESTKVVTGDKGQAQPEAGKSADVLDLDNLRALAGIKKA